MGVLLLCSAAEFTSDVGEIQRKNEVFLLYFIKVYFSNLDVRVKGTEEGEGEKEKKSKTWRALPSIGLPSEWTENVKVHHMKAGICEPNMTCHVKGRHPMIGLQHKLPPHCTLVRCWNRNAAQPLAL